MFVRMTRRNARQKLGLALWQWFELISFVPSVVQRGIGSLTPLKLQPRDYEPEKAMAFSFVRIFKYLDKMFAINHVLDQQPYLVELNR